MARPRKPTAIKELQGTLRKCRQNKNEIKPTIALTLAEPEGLNQWASMLWNQISEEYLSSGLITNLDHSSLHALCNEYGTYREASEIVRNKGLLIKMDVYSSKGNLTGTRYAANPLIRVANNAFKNYKCLCTEFGLTPASRGKLSIPEPKEFDRFAEFDL
jgi:P27 family predicted phage terminase small subunit